MSPAVAPTWQKGTKMAEKEKLVPVAPKIQAASAAWYREMFPSLNSGATFALNIFPDIYRYALMEIRGKFSKGELGMVLDVLNGHDVLFVAYSTSTSLIGHHLVLEIADSFRLYPGVYEEKWGISDSQDFLKRLGDLSMVHKMSLELWAASFWRNNESDLEQHCAPLLEGRGHDEPEEMIDLTDGIFEGDLK